MGTFDKRFSRRRPASRPKSVAIVLASALGGLVVGLLIIDADTFVKATVGGLVTVALYVILGAIFVGKT